MTSIPFDSTPLMMVTIEPIGHDRQRQVIAETQRYIALATAELDCPFEPVPVLFDLKGQVAGMYKITGRGKSVQRVIRYNPWIFAKYWDDNYTTTIPHEVAHYITEQLFGRVKPHGQEWQTVMALFGADNSRTSDFDMAGIPQRSVKTFNYRCDCRDHQLSIYRHNKVLKKGARYLCRFCNGPLRAS